MGHQRQYGDEFAHFVRNDQIADSQDREPLAYFRAGESALGSRLKRENGE